MKKFRRKFTEASKQYLCDNLDIPNHTAFINYTTISHNDEYAKFFPHATSWIFPYPKNRGSGGWRFVSTSLGTLLAIQKSILCPNWSKIQTLCQWSWNKSL